MEEENDTCNVLWLLLTNYSPPSACFLAYFATFVPVVKEVKMNKRKWNNWKLAIYRLLYVVTILLVQTDILTADDTLSQIQAGVCYSIPSETNEEIEPDDDYTRTRPAHFPAYDFLPAQATLIPNIYILPKPQVQKPRPLFYVLRNNGRQAELCVFRL